MTDIIKCISDNKILFGCIFVVVIIAFAYKINDFMPLLKQALGTILQQICSLIIEAVVLVFKIINSLEIYIVLMIDALTGKATSEGKIASLAIGVLSVASFYTTYTGLKSFVSEYSISFLITLGIQAILLATSLRINIIVKLDNDNVTSNKRTLLLKCSIILFIISIVTAYILSIFRLSYASSTIIYHVIYMIAIVAVLALIVLAVIHLSETGTLNRNEGRILFVIYFAVLSVSSFFSYNAFISVLYPNQVRDIDTFRTYKLGTIALVENIDNDIDRDYYDNLYNTINLELQNIMTSDKTCMIIIGLLIGENLAVIDGVHNDIYIAYNYQQTLERTSKVQSDLSHFRTLLGECNNLAALLQLIEKGTFTDNMLCISWKDIEDAEMKTEILSLIDVGVATSGADKTVRLKPQFASWLLDYTSKTSDRISFADMYTG